jgi:hypothetical protein
MQRSGIANALHDAQFDFTFIDWIIHHEHVQTLRTLQAWCEHANQSHGDGAADAQSRIAGQRT